MSNQGTWCVVRDCCRRGKCFDCRDSATTPVRVLHGYNYSREMAERIARYWSKFKAEATQGVNL